ncbi:MAG: IclR family transcriptional regulator [Microlunatus sp.]|nr:IclR family transcriptional regulator [Microlunatus sp.]
MTMADAVTKRAYRDGSQSRGSSVIVTAISVLRCFTIEQPLLGVTEIARQVGLHKSSVSRILATLEKEQIVERDEPSRKFRLGLGLLVVAGPLLADLDVRRLALPALRSLTERTGETSTLVVWSAGETVTVEQIPSPHLIKHTAGIGTRYREAESASVQIFLAGMSRERARGLLTAGHLTMRRHSAAEIEKYLDLLPDTAQRGYAVNHGRTSPDEVGIAAAVHDHRGDTIAAVLLAAPRYRVDPEVVADLGTATLTTAREISRRMGN